jgi:signal transduction histidine kinase
VQVALTLGSARDALDASPGEAREHLGEAIAQLAEAAAELREFARGVYPAALTEGGLEAALPALARRTPVPVRLTVTTGRLDPAVEATAYFVVAEALTNVARHAHATRARVDVQCYAEVLRVEVVDDGRGGAAEDGGSGLRGLADRVTALDGRLDVRSPPGDGTTLRVELPCGS